MSDTVYKGIDWAEGEDNVIVAFDPGITTGVATNDNGHYNLFVLYTPEDLYNWISDHRAVTQIVLEDFVTGGQVDVNMLHTIRLVGGILALAHIYGIPVDLRTSITRWAFKPKAKGMFPHAIIHARDALAHLLQYEHLLLKGVANPRKQLLEKFEQ